MIRILVFGTGDIYQRYKNLLKEQIICFIDNDETKIGKYIDGKLIVSPEKGIKYQYERIYILSVYYREMKEQLIRLGVDSDIIYNPLEVKKILKDRYNKSSMKSSCKHLYNPISTNKEKILFLTPDLNYNGALVALFAAMRSCLEAGFDVIVGAMQSGNAKDFLINSLQVKIVVDPYIVLSTMDEMDWVDKFDIVICNTVLFSDFLYKRNFDTKVIWWLHDPKYIYENINRDLLKKINFTNLLVYAAGEVAKQTFIEYSHYCNVEVLLFGLDDRKDFNKLEKTVSKRNFTFLTAGNIQNWKGQDLFAEAAAKTIDWMRDNSEEEEIDFIIVGNDNNGFANALKSKYHEYPQIKFIGARTHDYLMDKYSDIDVYCCTSRQETMSITSVEAMMMERTCIVSSAAGIAEYISDGIDGMIFESENVDSLVSKMLWCINNKNKISTMGVKARNIFVENFSYPKFSEKFLDIVKNM